jgi:hypothetical protein
MVDVKAYLGVALGLADAVARLVLVGCHLDLTN